METRISMTRLSVSSPEWDLVDTFNLVQMIRFPSRTVALYY